MPPLPPLRVPLAEHLCFRIVQEAIRVLLVPVCVDPHSFEVLDPEVSTEGTAALADGLDQCLAILDRHHKERGRQSVGEAGILGQN